MSLTALSSTSGAAPRPKLANVGPALARGLAFGVPGRDDGREPAREPGRDPWDASGGHPTRSSKRALGGAESGRVVRLSAGIAFPFTVGRTSSKLTGIPNDTNCFRRVRERVQSGGRVCGGGV